MPALCMPCTPALQAKPAFHVTEECTFSGQQPLLGHPYSSSFFPVFLTASVPLLFLFFTEMMEQIPEMLFFVAKMKTRKNAFSRTLFIFT